MFLIQIAGSTSGVAQTGFPSHTVRLVVSFPAGSATDIIGRLLADRLGRKWHVSVVVENITGAAGQIGTGRVARAEPDGYTLIVSPPAQLVTHGALYKNLSYDPTQLVPIALLAQVPYGLTVRKDPALATVKDFVAYAKSHPGKLTYASQGVGSTSHLTTKLFEKLAGIEMLHVPYRGSAPAMNDLVAGTIDFDVRKYWEFPRAAQRRPGADPCGRGQRARPLPPERANIQRGGFSRLSVDHLVCTRRAAQNAGELGLENQCRCARYSFAARSPGQIAPTRTHSRRHEQSGYEAFIKEEAMVWGKVIRDASVQSRVDRP